MGELETAGAVGAGGLAVVLLQAATRFVRETFGDPEARMRHKEALEKIESKSEVAAAKATEAEHRASSAAVTALAQRCEALEANLATVHQLLSQQTQKIELLANTNTNLVDKVQGLKDRVAHLEAQAVTDAATIADLQAKLEQARTELAEWVAKCGACEGKPELVQLTPQTKARGATKKGKRK